MGEPISGRRGLPAGRQIDAHLRRCFRERQWRSTWDGRVGSNGNRDGRPMSVPAFDCFLPTQDSGRAGADVHQPGRRPLMETGRAG